MPQISIASIASLVPQEQRVATAAQAAMVNLANAGAGVDVLRRIKFDQIGFDPADPTRSLNLIEQVNQTFTFLVSFAAARKLLELHQANGAMNLNLGTASGTDIESKPKGLFAAEVFAAVDPRNNRKLIKDIDKVAATNAQHKYVFFHAPSYATDGTRRIQALESRQNVQVWFVAL